MPKVISQTPLVDIVATRLKSDILDNRFKVGEKLVVRVLCDAYQVSETPVKQALNRLVSEGLVQVIPRRGFHVRQLSFSDYHQLMEARVVIEHFAVDTAIYELQYNPEYRAEMDEKIAENIRMFDLYLSSKSDHDYENARQSDWEFHELMARSTRNQYIVNYLGDLINQQKMYLLCHLQIKQRMLCCKIEHQQLYYGLINGDRDLAFDALNRHLVRTVEEHSKLFL